ncbi:MAG: energy transducer TonB, partial [Bacteroidota bacterium]|nr:energy transducer TonB [Bacteroidota bacterium]
LSFIVLKDGSITDIKVLRGIGGGADEEAIRVIKESPKWKPGLIKGEPVNVAYTMPIFFQLAGKAVEQKPN